MAKARLDVLLVHRGLAESRTAAQRLIMAGKIRVAGELITEPSRRVDENIPIELDSGPKYVSRGGEKLEPALHAFGLENLQGFVCADVGASTGGFTDCLLQHGAQKVYAIDVGYGILHWRIRQDPRVIVMERTNARHVESLPEAIHLVTVDASFISLKILLPVIKKWLASPMGHVIALIKPQFEAGREEVSKGEGVIRDEAVHQKVIKEVLQNAIELGYQVEGLIQSPLRGPKGNIEFLVHLTPGKGDPSVIDCLIQGVFVKPGN
ncbi:MULTISPECIES: TlyA family RNA methyltransferase [Anaerolinea]|uniref:TlyA family RNA methyltransferase n=1 Tax=Anaerolinea TaxID=233189 RepID=UPI002629AD08|nr:TlyA family RNA methyltransferase [Anaerolinea thermophila]